MSKTLARSVSATASGTTAPGFWARVFSGIAKARELQAEREVARYLANRPDLAKLVSRWQQHGSGERSLLESLR